MSKSEVINGIYRSYRPSENETCQEYLEPLLSEVFKTARRYFYDDDAAQEFTIQIWRELDDIEVAKSFAAYLHRRLTCDRLDLYRRQARNPEQQPPEILDADGKPFCDEEVLDILRYRSLPRDGRPAPDIDEMMASIGDPFVRRVAELLRQKKSLRKCAQVLEMPPATLRKRLERYRRKNIGNIAA